MRIASALAMAFLLAAGSSLCAAELLPGDAAPEFEMQGSDGKTYKLSDFRDKHAVVIAWFPKAFTGGCTKECISFREKGADLRKFDVAYFTASCDTPDLNKKFAESLSVDYPILSDPTREVAKAYGVLKDGGKNAMRHTIYIGKNGKILFVDRSVKAANHGADVAKQLQTLGVDKK